MVRWSVHVFGGKRTEFLGHVTALNESRALSEAIKVFQVPLDWQTRVIVARVQIGWLRRFVPEKLKSGKRRRA